MGDEIEIMSHRKYYRIADITIQVDSDLPIIDTTFLPKFIPFSVERPGDDTICISHHFSLPETEDFGEELYRQPPWAIYKRDDSWIYEGILTEAGNKRTWIFARFNHDYSTGKIYHPGNEGFHRGGFYSLTTFPTDQILLSHVLAQRNGFYLHSSGLILNNSGLLFMGHSGAGKSTTVKMLLNEAEILCDDRMIVRKTAEGFRIHGTWSHGEVPNVSPNSAPLKAVFLLEQAQENSIVPLTDRREILRRLIPCLIKPLTTREWWGEMLDLLNDMSKAVPFYIMYFDKSGRIVEDIRRVA